jgi:hypothetical protein
MPQSLRGVGVAREAVAKYPPDEKSTVFSSTAYITLRWAALMSPAPWRAIVAALRNWSALLTTVVLSAYVRSCSASAAYPSQGSARDCCHICTKAFSHTARQ